LLSGLLSRGVKALTSSLKLEGFANLRKLICQLTFFLIWL
jgi:hypothetical protein